MTAARRVAPARLTLYVCFIALTNAASTITTKLQCNATVTEQEAIARWSLLSELTFSRDSAAFADNIWIVGGVSASYYTKRLEYTTTRSDVIYSSDGVEWTEVLEEAPFRRRYGHSLITFTDSKDKLERLILLGGFSPEPATDIWVTTDGVSWTEAAATVPWSGRGFHCSVVFNGKLWVLGGSPMNNEVWSTSSVLSGPWKQQSNVPWSPRAAHACAVHEVMTNVTEGDSSREEFLFLMGGWRDTSLNDIWRMDSAGNWKLLSEAAPWDARAWFSLVSFDSRTNGDVQLGPRLWVLGGGIIGRGIEKMHPFSDVWYTRDGVKWVAASSNSSGISTAEWSMVTQSNTQVCMGKWGHSVVPFRRRVTRAYYCHESCTNEDGTISLANQLIPVCNPSTTVPEIPAQHTVLVNNSMLTKTIYPDGCGLCKTDPNARYQNSTSVPTLLLLAGNVGVQKVNDVFQSSDGMLCEREGKICSGEGVCVQGGNCLCNSGKTGSNCDSELGYTIIDSKSCFPESASVVVAGGKTKRLGDVKIGDSVLSIDEDGTPVYSTVYYIPHGSDRRGETEFISVKHEGMDDEQDFVEVLHLTPEHLVYYLPRKVQESKTFGFGLNSHVLIASLAQKPASELRMNDLLLTFPSPSRSFLRESNTETVSRPARNWSWSDGKTECQETPPAGLSLVRVTGLTRVKHRGAKTVYTMTGNVFVAGVLCSNFGDYYPMLPGQQWRDSVAFKLFALHRSVFRLLPYPSTAELLRALMDQLVLPVLTWLRPLLLSKQSSGVPVTSPQR
ncbi:Hint module [Phytophthora infestans]|uniref:Hint module n=1 Tax=Phytophthora infestans TaxID=4787 RepID=A0A8S9TR94_PHYIN|nr:Hint module [Phytophthora infestans]